MAEHTCHARSCNKAVPPRVFMCRAHWFSLPRSMRAAVWAAYVTGQERRKDPSPAYLAVTNDAIRFVAEREAAVHPHG